MSFLAGRLAATEGAYFLKQSKQAVTRLVSQTNNDNSKNTLQEEKADVLHEVLRHSLATKIIIQPPPPESSLSIFTEKKNLLSPRHPNGFFIIKVLHRIFLRMLGIHFVLMFLCLESLWAPEVGMAFFTATTIVFGGAVIAFGVTTSKLELHSSDDIKTKGRDLIQPKFETIREQLNPLRIWAKKMSAEWHVEKKEAVKDSPLAKELSKRLELSLCHIVEYQMGKSKGKGVRKGKGPSRRRGEEYPPHLMGVCRFGYNNYPNDEVMLARAYVDEHGDNVSRQEVHEHLSEYRDKKEAQRVAVGLPPYSSDEEDYFEDEEDYLETVLGRRCVPVFIEEETKVTSQPMSVDVQPPIQNPDFQNSDMLPPVQNSDIYYRDMGKLPTQELATKIKEVVEESHLLSSDRTATTTPVTKNPKIPKA
ncbi:hypothetical protein IFM89_004894 [Coptis chinensis]|uniref:Uncharacterized protein n=1 Tax=Coptis chinensis TaxID=261450 RepID=A0A835I113_9MAGN|nr:hypothetical protein IFM89_004894 [Coptis chinensis]